MRSGRGIPFWRDVRVWRVAGQVAAVLLVLAVAAWLYSNLQANLQKKNLGLGFGFLRREASFDIKELPIPYRPTDPYSRALAVGLVNTGRVILAGIPLATLVGIVIGVARLSSNWLVQKLALVYVEALRNTPLLLQLFFWYTAVAIRLPRIEDRLELPGPVLLSNRGIAVPWPAATPASGTWLVLLGVAAVAAVVVWRRQTRAMVERGGGGHPAVWAAGVLALAAAAALAATGRGPFAWSVPAVAGSRFAGGAQLSPEYAALVWGLVLYTGAFIAEIVRGGILAVSRGQWEAARALGLRPLLVLRLVVFPQALRIIIPPLTSQYLNLAKNSSLAVAIAYPDVVSVATTTYNQTGRAVEVVTLLMVTYLSISLFTSLLMNLYNRAVQLVER